MGLFFVNAGFLSLLAALEFIPVASQPDRRCASKKLLLVIGLSYLCFLAMFRGAACGNDTADYIEFFRKIETQTTLRGAIRCTSFEPLFTVLVFLLTRLTGNVQPLFIVTALFSFGVTGRFFLRYSRKPCLSMYLFFTLQVFDFYISGLRQVLAIAVLLLAYEAVDRKRNIRALLLILLSGLLHRTAWVAFPVFILLKIKKRRTFVWVTGAASLLCLAGSRWLVRGIASLFPRYQMYYGSSYLQSGAKLSLILYFLVYTLMLLAGELLRERPDAPDCSARDEMDFRLSFLLLPVCVMGYAVPIFSRVLQYFQVYLCVYFANRLSRKAGRNWQLLLICSMAAFAIYAFTIHLLRTPEWYTTYPFVFCWNN